MLLLLPYGKGKFGSYYSLWMSLVLSMPWSGSCRRSRQAGTSVVCGSDVLLAMNLFPCRIPCFTCVYTETPMFPPRVVHPSLLLAGSASHPLSAYLVPFVGWLVGR